jgi:hypothetical protein
VAKYIKEKFLEKIQIRNPQVLIKQITNKGKMLENDDDDGINYVNNNALVIVVIKEYLL